ncbi:putative RNA-binding protein 5 [Trypanosoma theileri]|uniref:Putative RNA-binding protein 5 n=1 Tax=Trypanosoma theileri TaxID=67003 RepID=A0A1X0NMV6_9TRYP|nr:putative RNA-binding protein 5 [Trypanosoma theileri]ORC86046.1 putative RNA-binding protein 5 [Trypanosoma theileri]
MDSKSMVDPSEFGRNVYVASLPLSFDDDQLFNLFAPYGSINSARIMRSKGTRQSKGYGFVLYKNPRSAELAISNLVGHVIDGNRIQVRLAHPDASIAYTGHRGSKSNSSTPSSRTLQVSTTTPQPQPQLPTEALLQTQTMVSQCTDPSMMMPTYPVSALYPTMYPPVVPSVVSTASASPMPNVFTPQVMLVPQFNSNMQQMTAQPTFYMVIPDNGTTNPALV